MQAGSGEGVTGGPDHTLATLLLIGFPGKSCAGGTPMSTASASCRLVLSTFKTFESALKPSCFPTHASKYVCHPVNFLGSPEAVPPISVSRTVPQGPGPSETCSVPSTMATLSWASRRLTNGCPSMAVSRLPSCWYRGNNSELAGRCGC